MEQPLTPALDIVAQAADVFERDLGLRRERLAAPERECAGRLEADFLPLQLARGLLGRDRTQVQGQVQRRAGRHQLLQEPRRERARPLAQVQGTGQAVADLDVALADHDFDRLSGVALGGRAAQR